MVGSHSCAHSPERRSGWLGSSSSCPPTRGETSAGTSAASSPHCQERATAWKVALARRRCGGMQQKRRGEGGRGHNLRAQVPWKGEVAMRRDLYSHYLRALGGRELLPSHGFVYPTWFVRVYPLISKCGRHGGSLQRAEHEFHETAAWLVSCSPACPHPRTPRWSGAPALGKSPHCFAGTEFSSSILSSILSGLRLREDEFTKMR